MKIVNKFKQRYTHYIGRPTIFGNPFVIGKDGTRENVIIKYERWARSRLYDIISKELSPLGQAIYNLPENAVLGCYCKPHECHGDIIIKLWEELHAKRNSG